MPIWMSLMNLFLLMLRQLSCSHDIHRSFSKVLCVCIFDELHHKQRVCSLLKSKNFDITVDVAKMFIICDKKMTCHEYVFFSFTCGCVCVCICFINETISKWIHIMLTLQLFQNASAFQIILLGIQFNSIFQSIQMTFFSIIMINWDYNQAEFSWKHRICTSTTHTHTLAHTFMLSNLPKTLDFTLPIFLILIHFLYDIPK